MTKSVSIAMCTYNGARFVGAQLESLIGQTRQPDELVVCDDGSTDDTTAIVDSFSIQAPFPVRIIKNETNLQPYRNFEQALSLCRGDVVFFCDQDDIWLPQKIERMLRRLTAAEAEFGAATPILVHCDLEVVETSLERIDSSFVRYFKLPTMEPDLNFIIFNNVVTGCASAMNAPLIEAMLPFPDPPDIETHFLHDWWSAICAAATGQILFLDESLVQYRIHGENAVGKLKNEDESLAHPRINGDNVVGKLRKTRDRREFSLESMKPANLYRHFQKKNAIAVRKIVHQIETAKQRHDFLRSTRLTNLNCTSAAHQQICDLANLDTESLFIRVPAIWRTRLKGKGPLKNLRRAIRIMAL